MSNFTMLDYICETHEAANHIVEESERLCIEFAQNFVKKNYKKVILVASGTSNNACVTAQYFMEKMLKVPCIPMTSYAFAHYENIINPKEDLVIAVTQEGESTNTIDALNKANELDVDNFVVTEDLNNTCTQTARHKVIIDCGPELLGPKTKGYTCTVLTLYIMALEAAKACGYVNYGEYHNYKIRMQMTINHIDHIIDVTKAWFEQNKESLLPCEKCYVIGYGANVGTAIEGALKSLETVRFQFFPFESEEFLHGPMASVKPDVYTILIAPKIQGYERANKIYKVMNSQNEHVYSIGAQDGEISPHILDADFLDDEDFSTLEYCVPLQLFAYLLYTAKGIDLNVRNYPRTRDELETKARIPQR